LSGLKASAEKVGAFTICLMRWPIYHPELQLVANLLNCNKAMSWLAAKIEYSNS